jgi:hypothetical protein
MRTELCRAGDDVLQPRPAWDPAGISWQVYVCGGGGSSALLGYTPRDPFAAAVLAPLLLATPPADAPSPSSGPSSGDVRSQLSSSLSSRSSSSSSSSSTTTTSHSDGGGAALLSCLNGRRLLFVGDSWARQLFLNVIEALQPSRGHAKDRPRYFHGGVSTAKDGFCKFGGAGPGIDFDRCGWPGNFTWRSRLEVSSARRDHGRRAHRHHHSYGTAIAPSAPPGSSSSESSGPDRRRTEAAAVGTSGVVATFLAKGYVDSPELDRHYAG